MTATRPSPADLAPLIATIEAGNTVDRPSDGKDDPDVRAAYREVAARFLDRLPPYPTGRFEGRGLVVCGGGSRYFPCAWVTIRMLRHLGCDLPIQLWHLGPRELDPRMDALIRGLGVEPVDAEAVCREYPRIIRGGWELKAYALLHCRFREAILLDSDNFPLIDPATLLDTPEFLNTGSIFWPDYGRLDPDRSAWDVFEVPYRDEPEFETGQIVVDKARCWDALQLAMHYNEHSRYYYHHVYGDKETFHLAFRRVSRPYAMPDRGIDPLDCCMCQHDFQGRRIFQHRNMDKWQLDGLNRSIFGFEHEDLARLFLDEIRTLWTGAPYGNPYPTDDDRARIASLVGRSVRYRPPVGNERTMILGPGGTIARGGSFRERAWTIREVGGRPLLSVLGRDGITCLLRPEGDTWRGGELRPEPPPGDPSDSAAL